jgi:hypothetical protein
MPVVDGGQADDARAVYLMTRDNMLEGDTGASGLARRLKRTVNPPAPLRIRVPAHTASNFEGLVVRDDAPSGAGHLWKLVRTYDDPATWTNRWTDPGLHELRQHLRMQRKQARATSVPERHQPWPYAARRPPFAQHGQIRSAAGHFVRRLFG